MSVLQIEITAPTLTPLLEKIITLLAPKTAPALPQTPDEQAARQRTVIPAPAPQPAPTYAPPAAPIAQPMQYAPAPQPQYQPAAPVNPTSAPRQVLSAVPVAAVQTAPTPPNAATSAIPAAPVTTYIAPTAMPVSPAPVATAPTFSLDDIARAASQLMDAGKQQELIGLLGKFGVQALTQLSKDQLGAFATELRQMGAKI